MKSKNNAGVREAILSKTFPRNRAVSDVSVLNYLFTKAASLYPQEAIPLEHIAMYVQGKPKLPGAHENIIKSTRSLINALRRQRHRSNKEVFPIVYVRGGSSNAGYRELVSEDDRVQESLRPLHTQVHNRLSKIELLTDKVIDWSQVRNEDNKKLRSQSLALLDALDIDKLDRLTEVREKERLQLKGKVSPPKKPAEKPKGAKKTAPESKTPESKTPKRSAKRAA